MEAKFKVGDEVKMKGTSCGDYIPKLTIIGSLGQAVTFPLTKYTLSHMIYSDSDFVLCKWWDQQNEKFAEEVFNVQSLEVPR
jgi:uncharacterized protein YodC (DUF2158 family)